MGKSTINGPFSIAMLNYQRVSSDMADFFLYIFGGVLKWGDPNSSMLYFIGNPMKMDGTPIDGNLDMVNQC